MLMGLRLTRAGVSDSWFSERFGASLAEVYRVEIEELTRAGLLEWSGPDGDALRLTPHGRLLGNQVFMRFV